MPDELISIVAPVYDEVDGLEEFCRRVAVALADERYELVLVDDGSRDGSGLLIQRLAQEDPAIRPLHLSRNFGHQAALTAGLDHARGDAVVTIDADLQDPPEVIGELVAQWRGGADVVHAVRRVRPGEPRIRLAAIRGFYALFGRIAGLPDFPGASGDFRCLSRRAVDAVNALPERNRFIRGLASWVGFEQRTVDYERDVRYAGRSKYPWRRLFGLALHGIVSFSGAPLRLAAVLGLLFSAAAFVTIPVVIVLRLLGLYEVSGIASVHILVLLIGGIQLVFLGVVGEYLGHNYDEAKGRPVYLLAPTPRSEQHPPADD